MPESHGRPRTSNLGDGSREPHYGRKTTVRLAAARSRPGRERGQSVRQACSRGASLLILYCLSLTNPSSITCSILYIFFPLFSTDWFTFSVCSSYIRMKIAGISHQFMHVFTYLSIYTLVYRSPFCLNIYTSIYRASTSTGAAWHGWRRGGSGGGSEGVLSGEWVTCNPVWRPRDVTCLAASWRRPYPAASPLMRRPSYSLTSP